MHELVYQLTTMHTVNFEFIIKSAECHQTLSSQVATGNETNDFPVYNMYDCQVLFNSLTEYNSSFTQLEEIPDKDSRKQPVKELTVMFKETFIPLL